MNGIEVNNESDIAAFERKHPHFMQLPSSTYDVLQQAASRLPEHKAIKYFIHGDSYDSENIPFKRHCQHHLSRLFLGIPSLKPYEEVTYQELFGKVTQTCNLLNDLGVQSIDTVSLLLPNFPETVYSLFAAETVGIANPVNPLLEPELIAGILKEVKCKVLITMGPVPGTDIWKKVMSIKDRIPSLEHIIVIKGRKTGQKNIHAYEQTIRKYSSTQLDNPQTRQLSEVACYYHTGGTTGIPKIVKSTYQNKLFSSKLLLALANVRPVDTGLLVLPLFHVNATINCLAAAMGGLTTVMPGPMGFRTPMVKDNFFKMAKHHGITYFSSVPTIFSALLTNKDIGKDHDIRFVVSGAAPLPDALQTAFEKATNIPIVEGYGQTEATVGSTLNPIFGKRKRGSVGLRFPFTQIKSVMLDHNNEYSRDCEVNEIGHLVVRGPHVCSGYLRKEHNDELWITDSDHKTWLSTGDLGRIDDEGFAAITGRLKEVIIRGGHNIDPKIIEDVLHSHPKVALAAAVGSPDQYAGEVPVAYVELKQDVTDNIAATEADILEYCRSHVPERAACPDKIRVLSQLPTTPIGKIYKPQLVRAEIKSVFLREITQLKDDYASLSIEVKQHQTHGCLATIHATLKPLTDKERFTSSIGERLSKYSTHYSLVTQ